MSWTPAGLVDSGEAYRRDSSRPALATGAWYPVSYVGNFLLVGT
ncbi:hypothetical protein ABZ749_19845 [Micromonospora sp. NPDC047753]